MKEKMLVALFIIAGMALAPMACDHILAQSELEDCLRYKAHVEQGYPMNVPQWCYEEGYLSE